MKRYTLNLNATLDNARLADEPATVVAAATLDPRNPGVRLHLIGAIGVGGDLSITLAPAEARKLWLLLGGLPAT